MARSSDGAAPDVVAFATYRLDLTAGLLYRGPDVVPLRPKAFAVLAHLGTRPGVLVSRDELLAAVWPDVTVTDDAPRFTIRELRRVLGDDPAAPHIIATVHGRGYRFIANETSQTAAAPATTQQQDAQLVGRAPELATLDGWLDNARSGERTIGLIAGDAGMGKTTLVDHFLAHVPAGTRVARGDCREAVGSGEPYQPLLEAVHALAQDRDDVIDSLRAHAPTWLAQIPSLVDPTEGAALRQQTLGSTGGRMAREFASFVAALAADAPLVLVVEDLHWSDGATLDALVALAHARGKAKLLVLATYRPVDVVVAAHPFRAVQMDLTRAKLARELPLSLLDEDAVQAYLTTRFGDVPPTVARFVADRSDGNPLFMTALADHLAANQWPEDAKAAGIPDTLRGMIERQLESLPPFNRSVLEVASVAGVEFATQSVVTALGELDPEVVEDACEDLARRTRVLRFLEDRAWPDGSRGARFVFAHALYRDVLYERLSASRRARLHLLIGDRLERGFGSDPDAVAAELGGHFERAGDRPRAVTWLARAAQVAQRRFADREAVETFRRALDLLDEGPEAQWTEITLRQEMGHSLAALHGERSPDLARSAERLRVLAAAVAESPGEIMARFSILTAELGDGQIAAGSATAARILDLGERVAPSFTDLGHLTYGITRCYAGAFAEARRHLEAVPRDGTPGAWAVAADPILIVLTHLSELVFVPLGHPREALQLLDASLAWAERLRHPYARVMAWNAAANTCAQLGDTAQALDYATQGDALCARYDVPSFAHRVALVKAAMQARSGQGSAGATQIETWLGVFERIGLVGKSVGILAAVEIAAAGDRLDEAVAYADEGLRFVDATGERMREAELLRWRGELELRRKSPRRARDWFARALDVATAQEARWFALRAATRLAARDRLPDILGAFADTDDWPDLRAARAVAARC